MVDAYEKGDLKNPSKKIKKAAKGMSKKQVKDFAKTKHKGLPEEVKENILRITEKNIRRAVNESINHLLKEDVDGNLYGLTKLTGKELYDEIDKALVQLGDDVYVSRFYSDDSQITIAANKNIGGGGRHRVIDIMYEFGYDYYTAGGNGEYVMMTFKPLKYS